MKPIILFFKVPKNVSYRPVRKVVLFFKATVKNQSGYILRQGSKGKNRWMRDDSGGTKKNDSEDQGKRMEEIDRLEDRSETSPFEPATPSAIETLVAWVLANQILLPSTVIHATNQHPDLTYKDWR